MVNDHANWLRDNYRYDDDDDYDYVNDHVNDYDDDDDYVANDYANNFKIFIVVIMLWL